MKNLIFMSLVPVVIVCLFSLTLYYHYKVHAATFDVAVIQGHVSASTSTVWIRNVNAASFVILARKSKALTPPQCIQAALESRAAALRTPKPTEEEGNGVAPAAAAADESEDFIRTAPTPLLEAEDFIATVTLRNLCPSTCFTYQVLFTSRTREAEDANTSKDSSTTLSLPYSFFTAPQLHEATPSISILFGSCISRTFFAPFDKLSIFSSILERHAPTFALLLGDVAYVDLHEALPYFRSTLPRAFQNTWSDTSLATFSGLVPMYLQRDDHEVYNDHIGPLPNPSDWARYVSSRHPTFLDPATGEEDGSVLYYHFDYGSGASVFVLDMRSHASPGAVLGALQLSRLKAWLLSRPRNALKIIAAPMTFTSVPSFAAPFEYAPQEKAALRELIATERLCGVVVLSGDTHWGGAYELMEGGGLPEFAASPFQALPFPGAPFFGGRGNEEGESKLFFSSWGFHYGILRVAGAQTEGLEISAEIYKFWPWDEGGRLVFEQKMMVADICPRDPVK
jgi:hypothetical protein